MGSGKTTVGERVAKQLDVPFADLDTIIELHLRQPIRDLFAKRGEAHFRQVEASLLREVLLPGQVTALGGGTPMLDASWTAIRERALTIWLDAPIEVLWTRIAAGSNRPLLSGRSREEVAAMLDARRERYAEADHRVDAARNLDDVVEEVVQIWFA
jgi:shikimate kinase